MHKMIVHILRPGAASYGVSVDVAVHITFIVKCVYNQPDPSLLGVFLYKKSSKDEEVIGYRGRPQLEVR